MSSLPRGDFFSLGGVLATTVKSDSALAPWVLSAAVLVALASWDPLTRGGGFDVTLLGLAAYELLIALTQPPETSPVPHPAWEPAGLARASRSRR